MTIETPLYGIACVLAYAAKEEFSGLLLTLLWPLFLALFLLLIIGESMK